MAARPDTARKILIYWMDGMIAFLAVLSVVVTVAAAMDGTISPALATITATCLIAFYALTPFLLRDAFETRPRPTAKLLIAGVFAVGSVVLVPHSTDSSTLWMQTESLWLSMAALYLPLWATACLAAAVVALLTGHTVLVTGETWQGVLLISAINAAVMIGAMLLWRWLWWVIRDAHRSREAKTRLTVAEERLRFARDLHDLLGHSLSVITLKSELAAKLATKDAGRAAAEMAEVRGLAGDSLARVQQAVHGYQALDLDEELAGVRAALEAAGARCVIDVRADGLSPAARTLLAWAVREGGTNVLKHSKATRCTITIAGGVLEMLNDGARGEPYTPGNGLRGLSERLATAGGSCSAIPTTAGEFLLRAAVPA
ncbi:sensor histidine kinase [Nonomuraea basaltis]|uniref:sensor histidine kinase n=1 Tax=Nonomuraea basaltis TaxID=2495887 RepID=UPI00110C4D69|nr:histidine kinase [Nonomuraea basaltis]TMR99285.1 sensor histidine kinase [Nonomuraea basaltis]